MTPPLTLAKTAKPLLPAVPLRINPPRAAKNSLGGFTTYGFTPAFDQIKSFTVKTALDGDLYPKDKLPTLVNYLNKRGVNVYGTNAAPCFIGRSNGAHHIYLPENPTVLQVKHELSHWLDFKKLGFNNYAKLSKYEREKMVLDRLQTNRLWNDLNNFEKDFSINYVEKIKLVGKIETRNEK